MVAAAAAGSAYKFVVFYLYVVTPLLMGGAEEIKPHTYGGARANHANRTSDVEFGARDALKER